jgi:dTDP-4-amino-4,6-dideoxygalactose transaminase
MDVDFVTRVVTLLEVVRAVDAGAKAVVVTHLYGLAIPEISLIAKYCREKGVLLLEDCAQAHGAKVNHQLVGTFGDAASFSFYPTKNLGALGDGGAVVTNNSAIAQKIKCLRQYGWAEKYKVAMLGARNSRLDEIQAAILSEFLPTLDSDNSRRRDIATRYSSSIQHSEVRLPELAGTEYVAHLYTICTPQRGALREHLYKLNVVSDIHYPIPDYRQPVFAEHFADVHLKVTERLSNEILTLPCYPEMSDSEVDNVIKAVNSWQL